MGAKPPNMLINPITHSDRARTLIDTDNQARTVKVWEDGSIGVIPEPPHLIPADYYLYQTVAIPIISTTAIIGNKFINVISSTGVVAGHAITLYEGVNMFQSLVKDTTATTISIASPIDFAFTSSAIVESGPWSMDVDGSVTPQIFSIKAPPESSVDIHTINCSMLDTSPMDDGLFGGLVALDTGLIFRFEDGVTKNLAVIVNNIGFWEIGFAIEYAPKAPAGQYGFRARRHVPTVDGVAVSLTSGGIAEFQIHVRDDLRDLDLFACTINGHMTHNE